MRTANLKFQVSFLIWGTVPPISLSILAKSHISLQFFLLQILPRGPFAGQLTRLKKTIICRLSKVVQPKVHKCDKTNLNTLPLILNALPPRLSICGVRLVIGGRDYCRFLGKPLLGAVWVASIPMLSATAHSFRMRWWRCWTGWYRIEWPVHPISPNSSRPLATDCLMSKNTKWDRLFSTKNRCI